MEAAAQYAPANAGMSNRLGSAPPQPNTFPGAIERIAAELKNQEETIQELTARARTLGAYLPAEKAEGNLTPGAIPTNICEHLHMLATRLETNGMRLHILSNAIAERL